MSATSRCTDWLGSGTSLATRPPQPWSTVIRTARSGSTYTVVLRAKASVMGLLPGAPQLQRIIFARGMYDQESDTPMQHAADGKGDEMVNLWRDTRNATTRAATTAAPSTPAPSTIATTPNPPFSSTTSHPPSVAPTSAGGAEEINTTIPGYTLQASSQEVEVLGGKMTLKWTVFAPESASTTARRTFSSLQEETAPPAHLLRFELAGRTSQYVAIGVAEADMEGPMIVVSANPSTGAALVSDWQGVGRTTIQPRAAATIARNAVVSADGRFVVRIQCSAASLNIVSGRQRVIVATGNHDIQFNAPLQHGDSTSDRDAIVVDFLAGTTTTEETDRHFVIAVAVVCGVCALYLVVASALNFAKIVLSPRASMVANGLTVALFIALVAFYAAMRYHDHEANLKSYAVERSFGDATVFCFWFVLYPVPKHLNLLRLTGSSYERLVPYHLLVGVLVLVAATCHLIAIGLTMTDWKTELMETGGEHPALFGFLAWLCLLALVGVSLGASRAAFWLLKLVHAVLFLPALCFACLHYHPLIYALIPPLLNWLADLLWRAKGHCQADAAVTRARFETAGDFTELTVTLARGAPRPGPGQFVLIGTTAAGFTADLHPFSVAWFDAKSNEALLCVKANGDGSWTRRLAERVASSPAGLSMSVAWLGPFGSLQVPLGKTPTCVLVAGGIGITALLSILQAVRERQDGGENVSRVVLLWTVRETALVETLQPLLAECVSTSSASGGSGGTPQSPAAVIQCVLFGGAAKFHAYAVTPPPPPPASRHPQCFRDTAARRLDVATDIPAALKDLGAPSTDSVGVYCCGPSTLMSAVLDYGKATPRTFVHCETFDMFGGLFAKRVRPGRTTTGKARGGAALAVTPSLSPSSAGGASSFLAQPIAPSPPSSPQNGTSYDAGYRYQDHETHRYSSSGNAFSPLAGEYSQEEYQSPILALPIRRRAEAGDGAAHNSNPDPRADLDLL
jgi:ferredoxin-NADP reductase